MGIVIRLPRKYEPSEDETTDMDRNSHDSGDGGGGMQARVAKLESDVDHIKKAIDDVKADVREIKRDARTDFRLLFGALIFVALGLAGLMAKGFHWL
ncbi:hypothetical protein ACFVGI_000881 [Serratia marcescens]|jgi:tetrahydromethanopterin S-methyltransferase subunit F